MIPLIIVISFLLDGVLSNFLSNTIFIPLFSIVSIVVLYPFFNNNVNKFIIVSSIVGLFFDIIYTNSLFINVFSFLLCSLVIIYINKFIKNSIISISLLNILSIIVYRIISYFLLCLFDYLRFDENILLSGIYCSLLSNVIYGISLYCICEYVHKKFKLKKAD